MRETWTRANEPFAFLPRLHALLQRLRSARNGASLYAITPQPQTADVPGAQNVSL